MSVTCFVFGSYIASCRPLVLSGNKTAEGLPEPSLQKAGFSLGRILDVIHTRPFSSTIGLWTLVSLCPGPRRNDPVLLPPLWSRRDGRQLAGRNAVGPIREHRHCSLWP